MISVSKLLSTFHSVQGTVTYFLGAKWPLDTTPAQARGKKSDCSNGARWLYHWAKESQPEMPDGSFIQHEWVERQLWRKLERYSDVQYAKDDLSRVFICFLQPLPGVAGHVFYVCGGATLECRGTYGFSSRKWNSLVFIFRRAVAYEVPTKEGMQGV